MRVLVMAMMAPLALGLASWGCDSPGGSGETTCGTTPEGGECSQTTDCVCGMVCETTVCTRLELPAGGGNGNGEGQPTPTTALGQQMVSLCDKIAGLSCVADDDADGCKEALLNAEGYLTQVGCTSQMQGYVSCLSGAAFTCNAQGEVDFPTQCTPQATTLQDCICADSVINQSCSPSPIDGFTESEPCVLSLNGSCGEEAEVECVPGASGWSCTCTEGLNVGTTFTAPGATEGTCCDLRSQVEAQCGVQTISFGL